MLRTLTLHPLSLLVGVGLAVLGLVAMGQGVPEHLTPSSAARLARASSCRKLLLTHFYLALNPEQARQQAARVHAGAIELARDGMVVAL